MIQGSPLIRPSAPTIGWSRGPERPLRSSSRSRRFLLDPQFLRNIVFHGFKGSFFPGHLPRETDTTCARSSTISARWRPSHQEVGLARLGDAPREAALSMAGVGQTQNALALELTSAQRKYLRGLARELDRVVPGRPRATSPTGRSRTGRGARQPRPGQGRSSNDFKETRRRSWREQAAERARAPARSSAISPVVVFLPAVPRRKEAPHRAAARRPPRRRPAQGEA